MSTAAEALFWLALLSLVYVYAGFPLLVIAVGAVRRRTVSTRPITPSISLIIAAYNEERVIAERLDNALASDYPPGSLEILVASDGSSDRTEAIVAGYASRGVRLLRLPRQGKNLALNEAVRQSTGELLVFSDATILHEPEALRALASNFADPTVGGVAGNCGYRIRQGSESSSQGEQLYWSYDTWLKEMENLTGNIVSAHGGLYATRRTLYTPLAGAGPVDDFMVSTAVIEQGQRLVFDAGARAYEYAVTRTVQEFTRRVRNMTMGLHSVAMQRRLLNPFRYGFYSLVLFSHKVLRRLVPVSLVVLLAASLYAAAVHWMYAAALVGEVTFYGLAAVGYLARRHPAGGRKLLYIPFYYCMANAAAMMALMRFARGQRISVWQPQRDAGAA